MTNKNLLKTYFSCYITLNYLANSTAWITYQTTNKCNTHNHKYHHPFHSQSSTNLYSTKHQKDIQKRVTKITDNHESSSSPLSIKPIRINKVLKLKHSRRETDTLISQGLVQVNNKVISLGHKVIPYKDNIKVNGVIIKHWEQYILDDADLLKLDDGKSKNVDQKHEYIKYWKPKGVQCSIDSGIENNILRRMQEKDGFVAKRRVFPVGYLDRDTSGLILLTSDERVSKAIFKGVVEQPKTYKVYLDKPISNQDIRILKNGVKIAKDTNKYRFNNSNNDNNGDISKNKYKKPQATLTTLPCTIQTKSPTILELTITDPETKNHRRQIPKMLYSLGYKVTKLHRINFCGIKLGKLKQSGEWIHLDEGEMRLIDGIISLFFDDDVAGSSN